MKLADRKTKGCSICYAARYLHELGCDIGKVGRLKKAVNQMAEMLEAL